MLQCLEYKIYLSSRGRSLNIDGSEPNTFSPSLLFNFPSAELHPPPLLSPLSKSSQALETVFPSAEIPSQHAILCHVAVAMKSTGGTMVQSEYQMLTPC